MYGQIGIGLAVLGGDSRSTGWDEREAAELGGSAGTTETTSVRTMMGPTNGCYFASAAYVASLDLVIQHYIGERHDVCDPMICPLGNGVGPGSFHRCR